MVEKIDLEAPYFQRPLVWRKDNHDAHCLLELWLPVATNDGTWSCAFRLSGFDKPIFGAMPGSDALDALIKGLTAIRSIVDQIDGTVSFEHWGGAGLPISLNFGISPDELASVEAEAVSGAQYRAGLPSAGRFSPEEVASITAGGHLPLVPGGAL